jgi:hypothetical protein
MMTDIVDVKAALTESLTELHLPTVRRTYEEAARLAERETLSYERYLLDLVTRESQDRQIRPLTPGDNRSNRESSSHEEEELCSSLVLLHRTSSI